MQQRVLDPEGVLIHLIYYPWRRRKTPNRPNAAGLSKREPMKHRKGIELLPEDCPPASSEPTDVTYADLAEWYYLAVECPHCGRRGRIDRHALARRFGARSPIRFAGAYLRCTKCGNRNGNRIMIGKLPR